MDIGRVSAILSASRPVAATGTAHRVPGTGTVEPPPSVADRETRRPVQRQEQALEGELLHSSRGFSSQSTQDYLQGRQFQASSAETQRNALRSAPSTSNRHALGQYTNHIRPETRQSFTQGIAIDTFV